MRPVILSLFIIFALSVSCEEDLRGDKDSLIDKLDETTWTVDESSSVFKSARNAYSVDIFRHESDSNRIRIYNFYQLGFGVNAAARISGNTLILDTQTLDNTFIILQGSGEVSSNVRRMDWTYTIELGTGETDEVTAVYSRNN